MTLALGKPQMNHIQSGTCGSREAERRSDSDQRSRFDPNSTEESETSIGGFSPKRQVAISGWARFSIA
jgi:hypothetical protein